jgi:hypothetical protein
LAPFRDRYNLFTGKLRVAPRPVVPAHWDVPADYPSATRFWVDPVSGATSWRQEGERWSRSEVLKQWHLRQTGRIWAGRRLVSRVGHEEATQRIKDLQLSLNGDIRQANSYLDLLISIEYEAYRLTRRAEIAEQMLISTTLQVLDVSARLGRTAHELDVAGNGVIAKAQAAARALDELAESLKQTVSPVQRRFELAVDEAESSRRPTRDVYEWIKYALPKRKYRKPDIQWLVASAVVTFRENKPDVSAEIACRRVSGYLALLDAPFGAPRAARAPA